MTTEPKNELPDEIFCGFCEKMQNATGIVKAGERVTAQNLIFSKDWRHEIFICESCVLLAASICAERDENTRPAKAVQGDKLLDRYGLALMMIKEGVKDPSKFAAEILEGAKGYDTNPSSE